MTNPGPQGGLRPDSRQPSRPSRLAAKLPSGQLSVSPDNLGLPPGDFHQRWRLVTVGRTLLTVIDARADQANKLVAIDMATGATRWSSSLGGALLHAVCRRPGPGAGSRCSPGGQRGAGGRPGRSGIRDDVRIRLEIDSSKERG
jgi:hypothetical protein